MVQWCWVNVQFTSPSLWQTTRLKYFLNWPLFQNNKPLTSGHLRIVYEGWAGSSENTMNRHSIDDPTQVGCAKQRSTVLVGTVCDYLDSFTLPVNPVSFFLFSPLFLLETVGKMLQHCPIGPTNSSIPCWKQLTW